MKAIPLTKGFATIVDDEDYDRLCKYRWYASLSNGGVYARRDDADRKRVYMHRFILGVSHQSIDHMNHDTLDNRKANLRFCTRAQNQHHQKLSKRNTSGVLGVSWYKKDRMFVAEITTNGSRERKAFKTLDEAREARREMTLRLHGEFASPEVKK
jgi:hypothetical protein